jgi:hypothetical protein
MSPSTLGLLLAPGACDDALYDPLPTLPTPTPTRVVSHLEPVLGPEGPTNATDSRGTRRVAANTARVRRAGTTTTQPAALCRTVLPSANPASFHQLSVNA